MPDAYGCSTARSEVVSRVVTVTPGRSAGVISADARGSSTRTVIS